MISRQLLTDVGNNLTKLPDDVSKVVSHYTLDKVQPRVVSFEEQVCVHFKYFMSCSYIFLINGYERNKTRSDYVFNSLF